MTDHAATTAATRAVIEGFYAAYTTGGLEGMLAMIADDAVVTFAGHGTFRGKAEIRRYMTWAGPQLPHLEFTVLATIVDGDRAAVPWSEVGTTKAGAPWQAIGCDTYRVAGGKIVELTVHGDTEKMLRLLEPWPPR
jgi:uncharacterized protein (TIGR02246 family)